MRDIWVFHVKRGRRGASKEAEVVGSDECQFDIYRVFHVERWGEKKGADG